MHTILMTMVLKWTTVHMWLSMNDLFTSDKRKEHGSDVYYWLPIHRVHGQQGQMPCIGHQKASCLLSPARKLPRYYMRVTCFCRKAFECYNLMQIIICAIRHVCMYVSSPRAPWARSFWSISLTRL